MTDLPIDERPWPALDVSGVRILVIGFGISGYAVADQTMQRGARVTVIDAVDDAERRERAEILEVLGADIRLGPDSMESLPDDVGIDLIVPTPGMSPTHLLMEQARERGITVWGEVELARRMQPADGPAWLGVTGTNGKTTVTTMLESILLASGARAVACGNIGLPLIEAALDPTGFEVLAVELSSFQLHRTEHADCEAAVVLNVGEDHLDWHGSLDAYARDKGRIYEGARIACVYSDADPRTRALVEGAEVQEGCRAIGVTLGAPAPSELGIVDDLLVDRAFVEDRKRQAAELAALDDLAQLGPHGAPPHLVFDALAAAALARAHGVAPVHVRDGLRAYRAGRHRAEIVGSRDGVAYLDDSKATNPDAAAASLLAAPSVVWIAGGQTKGADLGPLVQRAAPRLRGAVVIGSDPAPFLEALAEHAPAVPVTAVAAQGTDPDGLAALMDDAVRAAAAMAAEGDTVILAPAAASRDQFRDYAQRGDLFAQAVRALPDAPRGAEPGGDA